MERIQILMQDSLASRTAGFALGPVPSVLVYLFTPSCPLNVRPNLAMTNGQKFRPRRKSSHRASQKFGNARGSTSAVVLWTSRQGSRLRAEESSRLVAEGTIFGPAFDSILKCWRVQISKKTGGKVTKICIAMRRRAGVYSRHYENSAHMVAFSDIASRGRYLAGCKARCGGRSTEGIPDPVSGKAGRLWNVLGDAG